MTQVSIIVGDIARVVKVDAIIAPTNTSGSWGGIDDAIHRVANYHYRGQLDQVVGHQISLKHGQLVFAGPPNHRHQGSFREVIYMADGLETSLEELILDTLSYVQMANNISSLAMPVLRSGSGLGMREKNMQEIVDHIVVGIRDFELKYPESRLKIVIVVHNNPRAMDLLREHFPPVAKS